jgi:hypothetical protein
MSLTKTQAKCALADTTAYINKTWPDGVDIPYFSSDDGADKLSKWVHGFLEHLEAKNSAIASVYRSQPDNGEEIVLGLLKKVGRRLRHKRNSESARSRMAEAGADISERSGDCGTGGADSR